MQQVMYASGKLWGALDTSVNPDGGAQRAGIAWFIINPNGGKVNLDTPIDVASNVALSSSNTAVATVPATVPIAAGASFAPFTVTTHGVAADTAGEWSSSMVTEDTGRH